jgi:hypothetical protein
MVSGVHSQNTNIAMIARYTGDLRVLDAPTPILFLHRVHSRYGPKRYKAHRATWECVLRLSESGLRLRAPLPDYAAKKPNVLAPPQIGLRPAPPRTTTTPRLARGVL